MNEKNPYASNGNETRDASAFEPSASFHPDSIWPVAKRTFIVWERLRLFYIGMLVVVTVVAYEVFGPSEVLDLIRLILGGSFVANLAFFAGPSLDTYLRWLGYERSWPRWTMFILGTLLASVLAVYAIYQLDH